MLSEFLHLLLFEFLSAKVYLYDALILSVVRAVSNIAILLVLVEVLLALALDEFVIDLPELMGDFMFE